MLKNRYAYEKYDSKFAKIIIITIQETIKKNFKKKILKIIDL